MLADYARGDARGGRPVWSALNSFGKLDIV